MQLNFSHLSLLVVSLEPERVLADSVFVHRPETRELDIKTPKLSNQPFFSQQVTHGQQKLRNWWHLMLRGADRKKREEEEAKLDPRPTFLVAPSITISSHFKKKGV